MHEPDAPSRTPRTRRKARRVALITVAAIVLLALLSAFVVTRSAVLTRIVEPRLADALGADVSIGRASFEGANRVVLRDVRALAPGMSGPSAEVLVVPRLGATIDWSDLLAGRFGVRAVDFDAPTIRLSRDLSGSLNIDALKPRPGTGSLRLPRVIVRDATVEFGEHSPDAYSELASIEVDGELRRSPNADDRYVVALVESEESANERAPESPIPITLSGEYDPIEVEGALTLEHVDLASWGPRAAPSDVREFWSRLALAGRVAKTEFLYSEASGVEARFTFENVGLTLPIAADPQAFLETTPGPMAEPERLMRLSGASGVATIDARGVEAEITGLIEDLPYRVRVTSESVNVNTAFVINFETTEPFSVAQRPQLLPFAPPIVRERFRSFSGPTAMLEASVDVTRAAPTPEGPAPLRIAGEITFSDGVAAYESFPYQFNQMAGRVRFDSDAIYIDEISGIAPSGATIAATGVIAPPTHGAQVAIDVRVEHLPLDQTFAEALPESRADLLDEVFSPRAAELLSANSLLPDDFTLGGIGSLDVRVRRPLGDDSRWLWDATLFLPRAGLLIDRFPYPIIAENTTIVVSDEFAEVRMPLIRGIEGGEGDIQGRIILEENDVPCFEPILMVRAAGVPIDERLLAALPGGLAAPPESEPSGRSTSMIVRDLALEGSIDTISRILPRDDDSIGFDVFLEFSDLRSSLRDLGETALDDVDGRLEVSEYGVVVHELRARFGESQLEISGEAGFRSAQPRRTSLEVLAQSVDLGAPFERVISPFDPDAANALRAGIESGEVEGLLDLRLDLSRASIDDPISVVAKASNIERFTFGAFGGRVSIEDARGGATIEASASGERLARFDGFVANARFDDSAPSQILLSGAFDLRSLGDSEASPSATISLLSATTTLGWPSPIADALLRRAAPERAEQLKGFLARWGLTVRADLSAQIESGSERVTIREVSASPTELAIDRDGKSVDLEVESGKVVFRGADNSLQIDALRLRAESFHGEVNGDATLGAATAINLVISGAIAPFDDDVVRIFPRNVRDAIEAANLTATSVAFDDARVAIGRETTVDATLNYRGLAFDLGGAAVADMDGELEARIDSADERPLDATLRFDRANVGRIRLGQGGARLVLLDAGDTLVLPSFDADAYGGRVFGVAKLSGVRESFGARVSNAPLLYEIEGTMSGVSFDRLRADLRVGDPDAEAAAQLDQGGAIDALIAIAGVVGQPQDRVGRGSVRVWGGELVRLPLASRLIELSNLQAPTGEDIDFARAEFFVEGDIVNFESLVAASRSVNLDGIGTLRWPSLDLDLRFTSRGSRRAPILSDVIESFRNELVVSRVRGSLNEPSITVETLPATRRLLDSIFGQRNDRPVSERPAARSVRDANPRSIQ